MIVPDGPRVEFRSDLGTPKRSMKFPLPQTSETILRKKYYVLFYLGYRSFPDFL